MVRVSRSSVLNVLLIVVLLAALPGAIRRYIQTGEVYLFSPQFFADMFARLSGPGRFRFIMQPVVAIVLGARDGVKDAHAEAAPFLWSLIFHRRDRTQLLGSAYTTIHDLVIVAILLDVISQVLILRWVNPWAALLLGPVLIFMPYSASRALSNRFARRRSGRAPVARPS